MAKKQYFLNIVEGWIKSGKWHHENTMKGGKGKGSGASSSSAIGNALSCDFYVCLLVTFGALCGFS